MARRGAQAPAVSPRRDFPATGGVSAWYTAWSGPVPGVVRITCTLLADSQAGGAKNTPSASLPRQISSVPPPVT